MILRQLTLFGELTASGLETVNSASKDLINTLGEIVEIVGIVGLLEEQMARVGIVEIQVHIVGTATITTEKTLSRHIAG